MLLAGSQNDIVIDWDAAERYLKDSGSPNVEIQYYDESGHAFLVDHTAVDLASRIDDFLSSETGESPKNGSGIR